ncbi:hypothetical protein DOTSEDRAFT_73598 [Dothistroma septosporum NZE10]|uniref:RNA polymerase II holoenzyme cyclin-like subunit n=1 Tax=Dothistroma septosporum (strain NZE10 / CBS 128990) TaxID=675120 RepID=N1PIV4_DOTSN|nr:hypothetical protein DOTSEDRAFT_73598 [Dothistroma septosporum NZE10]
MPSASNTTHLPPTHPATRQRPKSPNRVLAEAEAQWIFSEAELANTPSIQDGMTQVEEKEYRAKGVNFIVQVGVMLKLPQLTLSTASILFQRFLMRASLKKERNGIPKLHHYQAAATALFLSTKVEESCRKMKELILAFCRVAQKNPNLQIDEQSKDWWKWRDCIMLNEDILLETLCFDLTVESPHRTLFDMLKFFGLEHSKRLRNAAWAFVTDSNNTQLCLLVNSRTIAAASLYAACKYCEVTIRDNDKGQPWWESFHVRLREIRRAVEHMAANYDTASKKFNGISSASGASDGNGSIYPGLTPGMDGANDGWDSTRAKSASPFPRISSERRHSNASSIGVKRERDEQPFQADEHMNGVLKEEADAKRPHLDVKAESNGTSAVAPKRPVAAESNGPDMQQREEAARVEDGNKQATLDVKARDIAKEPATPPRSDKIERAVSDDELSEEGQVDE